MIAEEEYLGMRDGALFYGQNSVNIIQLLGCRLYLSE